MTIFYTEILSPSKEIKAAAFSKHGAFLKNSKKLHLAIRKAVAALKHDDLYQYESDEFTIYIKAQRDILIVAADHSASASAVSVFMGRLTNDEDEIRNLMDTFNAEHIEKEIQDEIRAAKDICAQSLNRILDRGDRLRQLDELANQLDMQVKRLQRESRKLVDGGMVSRYMTFGAVVAFIFLVLYFIFK